MDGTLVWKIGHPVVNAQDGVGNFVFIQHMRGVAHQAVDVRLGQAIYLAELAQIAAAAERAHRSHQGNVSGLITIENTIIDRQSTRLNSSHERESRKPYSA